jgi:hypothetical protein
MTDTTYTPCPQGAGRAHANHTPPTRDVPRPRLHCGAALRTHVDGQVLGQASAGVMFAQDKSLIVPRSPSLVPRCCPAVPRPDHPSCCEPRNRYPTPSFPRSRAAVWSAQSGPRYLLEPSAPRHTIPNGNASGRALSHTLLLLWKRRAGFSCVSPPINWERGAFRLPGFSHPDTLKP